MTKSWSSPALGSIVMLTTGFQTTNVPHYGLVLGLFKYDEDHTRYLVVAPGSSVKANIDYNTPNTFVIKKKDSNQVLGNDTCFFIDSDLILVKDYPSSDFQLSRTSSTDEQTSMVGEIVMLNQLLKDHIQKTGLNLQEAINESIKSHGFSLDKLKPAKVSKPLFFG